jgi:hypothetical protein
MAGYLGDARQWRKFEKRTTKLFARFRVDIFHTIDVRRSDKDFAGWSVNKKIEFLDEFQHIANETLERGVAALLRYDDYDYYRTLVWPKGTQRDSMYAILFRAAASAIIDGVHSIDRWRFAVEPTLHIVLEEGHKNVGDAARFYKQVAEKFPESKALAGLTFGSKAESLPLAAADLFAYSAWGHEVGAKPIGVPAKPPKADQSYRGNAWRIEVRRETLDQLHEQTLRFAREHATERNRRRNARQRS